MNTNTPLSEPTLRLELAAARRRLTGWRCFALGVTGLVALGLTLAASSEGAAPEHGALVQVSSGEIIDLAKLNRVSRSSAAQSKNSVTFFFANEGEKSNFAIYGSDADVAWAKLSERVGEKWTSPAQK